MHLKAFVTCLLGSTVVHHNITGIGIHIQHQVLSFDISFIANPLVIISVKYLFVFCCCI